MSEIWFDQDSTNAFYLAPLGGMSASCLDAVVDNVSGGQVTRYFMCPGGETSIIKGKHWEIYAEGFDLEKGPEQPCMRGTKSEWLYRFAHNLHSIHKQGVDPLAYILKRARARGMESWISMRMNDIHCGEEPDSPLHCAFWREHPELRISDTAYENSFDFSHKSAREFILNRVFELIDKYDFDGLSLDWTRFPTFFPHGQGEKKLGLITEIIEAAREKIDHKSNSEKRKIGFGVRVPGLISVCRQRGLDAIEWSNRGLIDYIVIAPFLMTTDFDLPVEDWRKNTPKDFPVVCGVESTVCAYPGAPRTRMTPDEFRGAAGAMFCRGSRAVYLFNCFEYLQKDYPGMFKELGGIETIKGKSRAFRVTWHDNLMTIGEQDRMNRLPGEGDKWREFKTLNGTYPFELPAIIKPGGAKSFKIHTAFKPEKDARTLIEIKSSPANALHLTVTVNEISGVEFASYEDDVLFFKIQPDVLTDGFTIVKVQNNSGADVKLLDIRIKIDFTG